MTNIYFFFKLDFKSRFTIGPSSNFIIFTPLINARRRAAKQNNKEKINSCSYRGLTIIAGEIIFGLLSESNSKNKRGAVMRKDLDLKFKNFFSFAANDTIYVTITITPPRNIKISK